MTIELATLDQVASIHGLYRQIMDNMKTWAWSSDYINEHSIANDISRGELYCLKENGTIIAVCYAGGTFDKSWMTHFEKSTLKNPAWIGRIAVDIKTQKKGIGHSLSAYILADLQAKGYDGVRAFVSPENTASLKLCDKLGFEKINQLHEWDCDWYAFERKF